MSKCGAVLRRTLLNLIQSFPGACYEIFSSTTEWPCFRDVWLERSDSLQWFHGARFSKLAQLPDYYLVSVVPNRVLGFRLFLHLVKKCK